MNQYNHLSPEERAVIMLERQRGKSLRAIASVINRIPATISRELQRNSDTNDHYCATKAATSYTRRRLRCIKPRKIDTQP